MPKVDSYAGKCVSGLHRWGKEVRNMAGAYFAIYHQHCSKCRRIRVIEYGKRGNHVQGYLTPTEEEKAS